MNIVWFRRNFVAIVFIILALFLFGYSASRAWLLAFTFDESYSYTSYVKDSYINIFRYEFLTSNNHALNSICMKLSTEIFPVSDFSLRWHSLLGHLCFIIFSWFIFKDMRQPVFRIGAFIMLNFNPFMLDFFSLARGYGLGLGLVLASLYGLKKWMNSGRDNGYWLAVMFIFTGLATMANFTYINYFLALMAIVGLLLILKLRSEKNIYLFLKAIIISAFSAGPFLYYDLKMSFKLKAAKELYYGGKNGFWFDTVVSLIKSTLYDLPVNASLLIVMEVLLGCIIVSGLVFILYTLFHKQANPTGYDFFWVMVLLLAITVIGTQIQFYFLKTYFLVDRTALIFIPLFFIPVGYLFWYLYRMHKVSILLFIMISGFSVINFASKLNFRYTQTWKIEADVKNMMQDLNSIRMQNNPGKSDYFLSPMWTCAPSADFYRDVYHYSWLNNVEIRQPTLKENYFFFPDSEAFVVKMKPLKLIKRYPHTQFSLYENLAPTPRILVCSKHFSFEPGEPGTEGADYVAGHSKTGKYAVKIKPGSSSPLLTFSVGGLEGDSFYRVEASAWVYFDNPAKRGGELVIKASDGKQDYKWENLGMIRQFDIEGHWLHINFGLWMPRVRTKNDTVSILFTNNTTDLTYYVDEMEAKIIR